MRKIKSKDYIAEVCPGGIFAAFVALGKAHAVEEIELDIYGDSYRYALEDKYGDQLIGGFGSSLREIQGSMLLSDGRIFTCITSKEGGDTFQSGEVQTRFFMLTPKKK